MTTVSTCGACGDPCQYTGENTTVDMFTGLGLLTLDTICPEMLDRSLTHLSKKIQETVKGFIYTHALNGFHPNLLFLQLCVSSQANISNMFFNQRSPRPQEVGVVR